MSAAADTIARMVVGVEADPSGLKRGLADGVREVQKFEGKVVATAQQMQEALKRSGGDVQRAAKLIADQYQDAQRRVERSAAAIVAAQRAMQVAAIKAADQRLASQISRADPFIAGMGPIGFQMGQTLARSMAQGFAQGNAAANIRRVLAGAGVGGGAGLFGGGGIGSKGRAAFITGAFTLAGLGDAFSAGETKLTRFTQGLNQVIRSASVVASFFGTPGIIASGILAATSFMLDFFARTRDEVAQTAKAVKAEIDRIINSGEQLQRLRTLHFGEPAAGRGAAPGAFAGGIADLEARLATERGKRQNFATANAIQKNIRDLEKQLKPLLAERARLVASVLDPTSPPEIRGLSAVTVTAPAVGHEFDEMQRIIQRVLRLHRVLDESGSNTLTTAHRLVAQYFELGTAIETLRKNGASAFDAQVLSLRELRAEIEKALPAIKLLVTSIPEVTITRPGGAFPAPGRGEPFNTPSPRAPALDKSNVDTLTRLVGPTIGNFVTSVGRTIGGVLQTTLSAAMGPVALLFRALEPALRVLAPLLDKFVAPVAAVVEVIAVALEPALRLLFPIVKAVAIVLSFLAEIAQRVTAAIARAFGNLIIAIGRLIKGLSFGLAGGSVIRAGESILRFADSAKASADELAAVRKRLYGMQFGDTADAIAGLGDAARQTAEDLLNVPHGFRIALERFLATVPEAGPRQPPGAPPIGSGGGGKELPGGAQIVFEGPVTITTSAKNAEELFQDVSQVAREKSRQRFGTTVRAGETLAFAR